MILFAKLFKMVRGLSANKEVKTVENLAATHIKDGYISEPPKCTVISVTF